MTTFRKTAAIAASMIALGACSSAGGVGNVLGSIFGSGETQMAGLVRAVDPQAKQLIIQQKDSQAVFINYDGNTRVAYQGKLYAITNLERGDQIVARVTNTGTNSYYTDSITVTQSVTTTTSNGSIGGEVLQQISGTVYSIDRNSGTFLVDVGGGTRLTVAMPYNARSMDVQSFNSLRTGQQVRLQGVYLNSSRVELRQFNY